jgi:hypothetical protein
MNDIRVFDLVTVSDNNCVLNQRGGFDSAGIWTVVSVHDDFYVLSRGGRIMRVKPVGVLLHSKYNPTISIDIGLEEDGKETCE